MIIIDWISTPDHRLFNRAFFGCLELNKASCYVFSKELVVPEVRCLYLKSPSNRFGRLLSIIRLIRNLKNEKIFFLTYDPLLLPVITLFKRKFIVYEHNTTPEYGISKHFLFQKLFYSRRIVRLCQYRPQVERLSQITSSAVYLGSPLRLFKKRISRERDSVWLPTGIHLAPSYRANLSAIEEFSAIFEETTIIAKNAVAATISNSSHNNIKWKFLKRVEFDYGGLEVDSVLVSVCSSLRGTGWFNDAIGNKVPIIIFNKDTKNLFTHTFPGFPFVFVDSSLTKKEMLSMLASIRKFDVNSYVIENNSLICDRFTKALCHNLE
jgi:hypothetical protein